ncbi:glycosyltransferase [Lysinimonas soli]|uniref:Glycosyltransferase n=1 Tax=Lysinimonas soli TaxID=1074233 RepID=A0ABW0NX20_9MICO
MTVFVGLYNAIPYFDHLLSQIESQTAGAVRWLFVDNASSDDTWSRLTEWSTAADRDITIVRNGFNLGATGSIFVNLDLVTTEWVTFIHQDDIYLPNHLRILDETAAAAAEDVVGVFSDMARADHEGRAIGSFPPLIWMLPDLDPPTVFLALLRNHCIPWSALAVRTQVFRETEAPWHSTAFPDTEITMRLAGRGRFIHVERETMRYRDNMASESRSIDDRERKFGATVSLFRVFNSAEFASLARAISPTDRASFVTGLSNSITVRLGETDRAALVRAGALERLEQLWDNFESTGLAELAGIYGGLGATATSGLLDRMSAAAGGDPDRSTSIAPLPEGGMVTATDPASPARAIPSFLMTAYERIGHLVPYGIRRAAARIVIRLITRDNPLSAWRFEWR